MRSDMGTTLSEALWITSMSRGILSTLTFDLTGCITNLL